MDGEWTSWWANGIASTPREAAATRRAKRLLNALDSPLYPKSASREKGAGNFSLMRKPPGEARLVFARKARCVNFLAHDSPLPVRRPTVSIPCGAHGKVGAAKGRDRRLAVDASTSLRRSRGATARGLRVKT
jgi:hypothetical protein